MSIRAWKRIITLFVVLIILSLFIAVLILTQKYNQISDKYDTIINNKTVTDLSEDGYDTLEDLKSLSKFFNSIDINQNLEYYAKYPELYVDNDFNFSGISKNKVCYLTFDDGPDAVNSSQILDILKDYDIKATFFVLKKTGKKETALYRRIVEEGHTIGIHSTNHDYTSIYSSVSSFLDDFNECSEYIEDITGVKPEICRFPGGSINTYNINIYQQIIAEILRRGYVYYDWNIAGGDASNLTISSSEIADNVLKSNNLIRKIVLLHDGSGHDSTVEALPKIIEGLREQGYEFKALDNTVTPICFGY